MDQLMFPQTKHTDRHDLILSIASLLDGLDGWTESL